MDINKEATTLAEKITGISIDTESVKELHKLVKVTKLILKSYGRVCWEQRKADMQDSYHSLSVDCEHGEITVDTTKWYDIIHVEDIERTPLLTDKNIISVIK